MKVVITLNGKREDACTFNERLAFASVENTFTMTHAYLIRTKTDTLRHQVTMALLHIPREQRTPEAYTAAEENAIKPFSEADLFGLARQAAIDHGAKFFPEFRFEIMPFVVSPGGETAH